MVISSNIKKYRKLNQFSQEELASKMNISRQSISKWERGDALPSVENLVRLSELLDLSLDELILEKQNFPLPFEFDRLKSKFIFIVWMLLPFLMIVTNLKDVFISRESQIAVFAGVVYIFFIQATGYINFKRYYTYFTISKTGIEYFKKNRYVPVLIRAFLGMFGIRKSKHIDYHEIEKMEIYFNNEGNTGLGTTVAYRPRQMYYNRESFLLIIHLRDGEKIELNLDRVFFKDSPERKYFCSMFNYFESKGILIKDDYNILSSINNEFDLIEEAYKLTQV
ncbi:MULTISPECIES: helix-turn-helix transcriptional regulator [Vagococcus]|uniref:Transcriptional regulator, XRE family n=1 Tax=Vagococcus fluvialis bH819 TaxID=1255619 RepID=A0A1X6WQK0_9ENTE|nr:MULTISPECIES: helix-turn-helix transcriptional regulator [Vagococcus]SLM86512.1 Transcriptional regulator, XRE family [Vagococcus fluvialis bH819]HCM90719.1 XRE family transcriptional regulator [Vagococcus sp.]